jgi:steroid 5-alpha reductase family enzyme
MNLWFLLAVATRRNDLADTAWGLGFVLVAAFALAKSGADNPRMVLAFILVLLWGLRLAFHIFTRNRGRSEDSRYRAWREQWGKTWLVQSYLKVFIFQGFLLLAVITPVYFIAVRSFNGWSWLDLLGAIVWLIGFYIEAVGDWQLRRFTADTANKGKVMDQGLWRYSRHPNYFGEVLMWWGIYFISLSLPGAWPGFIGPALITYLILFVSGIPLLEKRYANDPAYAEYKKRTSVFIPWTVRK